jgi:hypothetical protein
MQTPLFRILRSNPYSVVWFFIGIISFSLFTTVLTTYPLIDDYIPRSMMMFLHWDTWQSFFLYVYNSSVGGVFNTINTVLFGVWVCLSQIYYSTVFASNGTGLSAAEPRGAWGAIIATLGGGCASCGFTFLINLFGGAFAGILGAFPLGGAEFGIIGTILLILSIYKLVDSIDTFIPGVCTTE